MKINEIIVNARSQVRSKADGALAVEVLLGHCLKISRERLYLSDNLDVTDADVNRFRELLERFVAGEPVAYLVGNKEFFGLDFFVDRRVLTPRPETEILVENVISFAWTLVPAAAILPWLWLKTWMKLWCTAATYQGRRWRSRK
jgi:methylase of polypeptide subunit release factors